MANIFGDSPPQDMVRSNKGWLRAKKGGVRSNVGLLRKENAGLKDRLEQLEAAVEQLGNKKKK